VLQLAQVEQQMVEMGYKEAAARLLAELAHCTLSVARCTVINLVHQASSIFFEF
jgi:hypothetical protein